MTNNSKRHKLQSLLDDLHGDVDLDDPDLELDIDNSNQSGVKVTELDITRPILADDNEQLVEINQDIQTGDGQILNVTVRKHEQCPNCNWTPSHPVEHYLEMDMEPPEIKGRCRECGCLTCTDCQTRCNTCDRTMCSKCSDGYGSQEMVLCPKHREDVANERQIELSIDIWEQHREDEAMILEHETRREIAFRELELQYREQELRRREQAHRERIDELKIWLQAQDQLTRQKLEKYRIKIQEEIDRRQQMIELYKTASQNQLERDKLEFQKQQHNDEMDMQHRQHRFQEDKERFQQQLAQEKQDLQKIQALVDAADRLGNEQQKQRVAENLATAVKGLDNRPQLTATIQ